MIEKRFYVYASFFNGKRGWYRIRGVDASGNYIGNFPEGVDKLPGLKYCQDRPKGKQVSEQVVKEYFGYIDREVENVS